METFWSRVDKNGPMHAHLGSRCWLWLGGLGGKGSLSQRYGQFGLHRAHRVSYQALVGPIPAGRVLDHLCRRRRCVNPDHVEPVTHRVNILRGVGLAAQNARKLRCKSGHRLSGNNLLATTSKGRPCRVCRACAAKRKREWKARNLK